jgi:uncharacterized membrane protein
MLEGAEKRVVKPVHPAPSRLFAPDALRGLIIALMALDHASVFVAQKHPPGEMWGGAFPVYSDPLAFLTRFVTHFCAPGFFFLMGVGMALFAQSRREQGWSRGRVIGHFLIRGGAILAVKLLVVNRAWELSPGGWDIDLYIGVLFALAANLILGSLLLWLRPTYLLALAAVLLVGTELLVPDPERWGQGFSLLNRLLLTPGASALAEGDFFIWVNYPVLPWLELVVFGLAFGAWLSRDPQQAASRAWKLGIAFLFAFTVLRFLDSFGNIRPRLGEDWMDFLNPVKYPPSITFTLLTTGVNLIVLGLLCRVGERVQKALQPWVVFGRTPLFFYVLHLFLYAGLGALLAPRGSSLPAMYPVWLLGLLILYPLCLLYARLKRRRPAGAILQFL